MTRIENVRKKGYRDGWRLHICGAEQQLRFIDEIGVNGAHGVAAIDCAERLRETAGSPHVRGRRTCSWSSTATAPPAR